MTTSPFTIQKKSCDDAARWAARKLESVGFQVIQTFDLQAARHAHLDCACPHHGTAQCGCQLVVLLVYPANNLPATLLIHGDEDSCSFFLVNTPQQLISPTLEQRIQNALLTELEILA